METKLEYCIVNSLHGHIEILQEAFRKFTPDKISEKDYEKMLETKTITLEDEDEVRCFLALPTILRQLDTLFNYIDEQEDAWTKIFHKERYDSENPRREDFLESLGRMDAFKDVNKLSRELR